MKSKSSFLAISIFLLLGSGWWLIFNVIRDSLTYPINMETEPDMFITDMVYKKMRPDNGLISTQVISSSVVHYPKDDTYLLQVPHLTKINNDQQIWRIQSANAKSTNNQSVITLFGDVNIHKFANSTTNIADTLIKTESVNLYPNKGIAETNQPLSIMQQENVVKSIGAWLDYKNDVLRLLTKVEGQYTPNGQPPTLYKSDQAECKQKNNSCTYKGAAEFQKEKSALTGPEISIYRDNAGDIQKIVALGLPAYYNTVVNKKPLNAKANQIEIFPKDNLMVLTGKAEVLQEQNKFNSDYIKYDIQKQIIMSQPMEGSTTTIFVPPENK